jgi:hypothetical protein
LHAHGERETKSKAIPMQNLPQPTKDAPSALARIGLYVLVPVAGILLLPFLLIFVVIFYLLAFFQGARVFVFSFGKRDDNIDEELQKPHFLEIQAKQKVLTDQSTPPSES